MPIRGAWPMIFVLVCTLPAGPAAAADGQNSDASFALGDALTLDPAAFAAAPLKPLHLPGYADGKDLDVSRTDKPDGSSTFTVKKPLPIDVDNRFGADIAPAAPTTFQPGRPFPGGAGSLDSGAAWASVGVPNLASLDARVDPDSDRGKVGTTLHHTVPVGSRLLLTLQDTVAVTDTLGARGTAEPLSVAAPVATSAPTQFWGNEQKLKFEVLPTGTSLSAGVATSSIDPVSHNTFSADQKIYGPLHVTTSLNDVGEPTSSKSITAGFKLNW